MTYNPNPVFIMAEQGHVLSVQCEADGPDEPIQYSYTVLLPDGRERALDWSPWHWLEPTNRG